jgi:hypothetical protein
MTRLGWLISLTLFAASAFVMGILTGSIYHRLYPLLMGWLAWLN